MHYRAVFISDLHLGTPGCQAEALLDFLKSHTSDTLYLVGDIVDGWQLKRRWYWHQTHNDVVQLVLKKAKKGTKVIFVPGNHDEAVRQFIGLDFGGIKIRDELIHTCANGKRMLVLHGDRFDGVIACAKWLAYVGDSLVMDVRGSRAAGLHPILVDPYDDATDHDVERIKMLGDLLPLI